MSKGQTPSQTVGPYFAYGLTAEQYGYRFSSLAAPTLVTEDTDGEPIRVEGQVFDGQGNTIGDAMLEIWQADAQGRYAHSTDPRASNAAFRGFGRCGTGTDPHERFAFDTVKPGSGEPGHAPHINVIVFMRGLLLHAYTKIYFSDETEANAADPVLALVPQDRRGTLIAKRQETLRGVVYHFDIHMQGPKETVFFDI